MKTSKLLLFIALMTALFASAVSSDAGDTSVRGYWRDTNHDGYKDSYVAPYRRTSPDATEQNNYSYPGNYNPNTGSVTPGDPYRHKTNDKYHFLSE